MPGRFRPVSAPPRLIRQPQTTHPPPTVQVKVASDTDEKSAYFVFFSATAARSPSARSSRVNSLNRRS